MSVWFFRSAHKHDLLSIILQVKKNTELTNIISCLRMFICLYIEWVIFSVGNFVANNVIL